MLLTGKVLAHRIPKTILKAVRFGLLLMCPGGTRGTFPIRSDDSVRLQSNFVIYPLLTHLKLNSNYLKKKKSEYYQFIKIAMCKSDASRIRFSCKSSLCV